MKDTDTGVVAGIRVSHDVASIEDIEAARFDDVESAAAALREEPGVTEAFAFQTCHRVEAYVVASTDAAGRSALDRALDAEHVVEMDHESALRHLLRVAAGLESVVLGEDQVLGQVRDGFEASRNAVGPVLRDAVTKAIHVGERARTETRINEGVVSLGSAAVELAGDYRDLAGSTAVVVGAGEMGRLAAKAFAAADAGHVTVANRTVEHASWVVDELDASADAVGLDALGDAVADAEVVVAATGATDPIVTEAHPVGDAVCIDLGQPRDVATALDEETTVLTLDDLEDVTASTRERRREAAERVDHMVTEEFENLLVQYKRKRADEVIGAMYASAGQLKSRELDTAFSKLEARGGITDEQREVVESLADALVSQILAAPTKSLRDAAQEDDWATIAAALDLFDPEFEDESAFPGTTPDEIVAADDD
ncbi:glutamyl-tRNA reductase [Halocalculus aciditolerans]|uniref:Glutamyl-tRNA reductase n=1 Tax=Halocalculus aciditolerans TaxID=1383812 RepID=A0A830F3E9_9EURY|nr:glutamyl-tRNA reductase [Halocalculus aciditolerans]GGL51272.1 glutamyl-tRNA reductase [Halocalculus aciditolerans]